MTSPRALQFDGVWKRFHRGQRVDTLRGLLLRLARRGVRRHPREDPQAFWALRDISVEVPPGKVLGVIGRNGSGKSTLLKLAAGIMRPDRGEITAEGTIGALIELAAGFHGELTGRENVFFQGAVMGLSRERIRSRFDEIVSFAELEAFIDTPIKRYSSGMNARLGFSIAVHMDPDILLIDEVLSVGDREFQAKAVGRLNEMVKREIPVVVVSHQLDRIVTLANEAVLLYQGGVVASGSPQDVVKAYVEGVDVAETPESEGRGVLLKGLGADRLPEVRSGETATVVVEGEIVDPKDALGLGVAIAIRTMPDEVVLFWTDHRKCSVDLPSAGAFRIAFELDVALGPGLYRVQPFLWDAARRREVGMGTSALLEVIGDPRSVGRVNLRPTARLLP